MQIVRVELENIKSYESGEFEFGPGLIAICGPNGAGKTTILEAIAWSLFNKLPYTQKDFIRRGERRGSVNITFISPADGREYVVYRDTTGRHYVYDPGTKIKLVEGNNDVMRWIKEQLRVDPGMSLEMLFESAVGVPQGKLTVSFSNPPADRKKEFDKILRADEYARASEELKAVTHLIESRMAQVREEMARAEEQVSMLGGLIIEYEGLKAEIPELERQLELAKQNCDRLRAEKERLEELRRKLEKAESDERIASREIERLQEDITRLSEDLRESREARLAIEAAAPGFNAYNEANARLGKLLEEQRRRDELNGQLAEKKRELARIEASLESLREKLNQIKLQEEELIRLAPSIKEQEELEGRAGKLRLELGRMADIQGDADSIAKELERLRAKIQELARKIAEAESARTKASELESLKAEHQRALEDVTRLRLSIEQDEKFLSGIRGGLCPLLQEKCLNMKEGQTLDQYVKLQIANRKDELDQLERQRRALEEKMKEAQEAQNVLASLPTLRAQQQEAEGERARKESSLAQLLDRLSSMGRLQEELRQVERLLDELGDPRGRARAIKGNISGKEELLRQIESAQSEERRLTEDVSGLQSLLDELVGLDQEVDRQRELLIRYEADHRTYLEKKAIADQLEARARELDRKNKELEGRKREHENLVASLSRLRSLYDEAQYETIERDLQEELIRQGKLEDRLRSSRERAECLKLRIEELQESERKLESLRAQRDRLEQLGQLSGFIRDLLKRAGPHITESLVYSISLEANQLYRDITGNQNVTLRWDPEDYDILLEENGHERGFANLSGGEQMAAALSVRLALLKELSDLRIAFFDEPTANLDEQRRRRLAEEISRITDFDQLFIISHDDAFESFAYQVVHVPGAGAGSLERKRAGAD